VFLSTNNGTSWSAINTGLTENIIYAILSSGANLFAGSANGGVFLSTNNGAGWTAFNNGLTNTSIQTLAVSGSNLFTGTYNGGVFLSTNNGTSWSAVNTGLTNTNVFSLVFSGTNLFAGTRLGIFHSSNNGALWQEVSTGLTNTYINILSVSGTNLFAGTWGSGVWKRPLQEIVSVNNISNGLPVNYELKQNYPNPFNPSTKVVFALPNNSFTKLIVYDILGRETVTLVNEQLDAGTYETDFDGTNFSAGIYFYTLTTGDFTETKRMVLVK
jgi:hypothetical protein